MFMIALCALSATARLLGEQHELGFFAGRIAKGVWRYPEVTRRSLQAAWFAWAVAFAVALSPLDPIPSLWDEVALGALALGVLWHRLFAARRVGH